MRAAGCAINDFADRKVDGHVERTKTRPLATGLFEQRSSICILGSCFSKCMFVVLLPIETFYWSFGALF